MRRDDRDDETLRSLAETLGMLRETADKWRAYLEDLCPEASDFLQCTNEALYKTQSALCILAGEKNPPRDEQDAIWQAFIESHTELKGFMASRDRYLFTGDYDPPSFANERLLNALRRISKPEGVTTREIIDAVLPAEEWCDVEPRLSLGRIGPLVGTRLGKLSREAGGVEQVRRPEAGKPALWRAA